MTSPLPRLLGFLLPLLLLVCFCRPDQALAMGGTGGMPKTGTAAYRSFGVWDEASNLRFDLAVWYPGGSSGSDAVMDGRRFEASSGKPTPGFYPIILLSHDTAGNRFDSGDLAAALAAQGFMVIAPTHDGDNMRDAGRTFSLESLADRPRFLLLALEAVLDSPDLGPLADESRIGLVGVGYGAITVFQLLGARPDPGLLAAYCPTVNHQDIFCASWSGRRMARMGREISLPAARSLREALTPSLTSFAPALEPAPVRQEVPMPRSLPLSAVAAKLPAVAEAAEEERNSYAAALDFQGGALFGTFSGAKFVHIEPPDTSGSLQLVAREANPRSPQAQQVNPRQAKTRRRSPQVRAIRAAVVVAPAGGMLFAPEELQRIKIPVAMVEAGQDEVYPPADHAQPFVARLPAQPEILLLPEADHFSLFAPCDSEKSVGQRCGRLTDRARKSLADKRDAFLLSFFLATLGGAAPPESPGPYVVTEHPSTRLPAAAGPAGNSRRAPGRP